MEASSICARLCLQRGQEMCSLLANVLLCGSNGFSKRCFPPIINNPCAVKGYCSSVYE